MPRPPVMEALEGRRLFAAGPFILPVVPVVLGPINPPAIAGPAAPSAGPPASSPSVTPTPTPAPVGTPTTPVVRSTDLTGKFKGEIKAKLFWFINKSFDAVLDIQTQTATGLTGSIEIDGHAFSGAFTGKVKPSGRFAYTLKDDGAKIKIDGRLNKVGNRMEGKIEAKYSVIKVKGKFDFKDTGQ